MLSYENRPVFRAFIDELYYEHEMRELLIGSFGLLNEYEEYDHPTIIQYDDGEFLSTTLHRPS